MISLLHNKNNLKLWCFWTVVLEKTLESPLDGKEVQPVQPKGDQSWIFIGRTNPEAETPILWPPDVTKPTRWKRPWFWERLKGRRRSDDRGWDGWMASQTRWTWVWASSRSWWWTGKPGILQSMGSQSFRHDWTTELTWTRPQLIGKKQVCWQRLSALLSSSVQMLISFENTFMDTSPFSSYLGHPSNQLSWHIKLTVLW